MSELLFKQFELTRGNFIKRVEPIQNDIVDIIPSGFNNNIHWIVGHVLTVAEQFLFGFPTQSNYLPANYKELFGNGTKPADWNENIPSVEELVEQLKVQLTRIKEIPSERFNDQLEKPFLGLETFGELANMAIFHEANHLGQIQTMKRLIETTDINK
ncbi:DinB family protein [Neobacillus sp. PS3-40]|uniref:DinB family protein n=1 Tax=Neobacillus sp. PS3-40 TaxID=3070679 RepID=UPI0027DF5C60|nr:DinB family protein [Neobacillus sp. PS3-40]WML42660.1 DinB family protein [Neobacillus sp. PS3-40]